jgi:hypothetical protein
MSELCYGSANEEDFRLASLQSAYLLSRIDFRNFLSNKTLKNRGLTRLQLINRWDDFRLKLSRLVLDVGQLRRGTSPEMAETFRLLLVAIYR